jgi:hypothetical protein
MAASPPSEDFKYFVAGRWSHRDRSTILGSNTEQTGDVLLQLPWNNTGVAFQFHLLAGDFREARSLRSGGRYMCCICVPVPQPGVSLLNDTLLEGSSVCGPLVTSGQLGWFVDVNDLRLLKEAEVPAINFTLRLCAIPIANSQLGVGSASGHNARAYSCQTRAASMACLGCAGVGVPRDRPQNVALEPRVEAMARLGRDSSIPLIQWPACRPHVALVIAGQLVWPVSPSRDCER